MTLASDDTYEEDEEDEEDFFCRQNVVSRIYVLLSSNPVPGMGWGLGEGGCVCVSSQCWQCQEFESF